MDPLDRLVLFLTFLVAAVACLLAIWAVVLGLRAHSRIDADRRARAGGAYRPPTRGGHGFSESAPERPSVTPPPAPPGGGGIALPERSSGAHRAAEPAPVEPQTEELQRLELPTAEQPAERRPSPRPRPELPRPGEL